VGNVGFLRDGKDGCTLFIKVIPRASENIVVGEENGELKVRLKAPPVDGAANEALVRFLAERLKTTRSSIELVSGETSRHKVVRVLKVKASEILGLMAQ
jgi:hypothetical protein